MLTNEKIEDLAKKVMNGEQWLNKAKPGWYNDIVLDQLMMADPHSCICGQLFGDYWNVVSFGYSDTKMTEDQAVTRGFLADLDDLDIGRTYDDECIINTIRETYDMLGFLWRERIEKHRAEDGTMLG